MPGNIRLADAMRTLTVTTKDDGYELESTAGKAFYNAWGSRGKVEGVPEYFPISLSVKDKSKPVEPKAELSKALQNLDEQVSVAASSVNEAHIESARINNGNISEAYICGNTIEQETLSVVLANCLHSVNPKEASDVALKLATAVKLAFNSLRLPIGGFAKNQPGPVLFNEDLSQKGQSSSPRKAGTLGDEAKVSTQTLKLELDTSDICKQIDVAYSILADRIKVTNQSADNTGLQALSNRVFHMEAALASQGVQIIELQAKHASPR